MSVKINENVILLQCGVFPKGGLTVYERWIRTHPYSSDTKPTVVVYHIGGGTIYVPIAIWFSVKSQDGRQYEKIAKCVVVTEGRWSGLFTVTFVLPPDACVYQLYGWDMKKRESISIPDLERAVQDDYDGIRIPPDTEEWTFIGMLHTVECTILENVHPELRSTYLNEKGDEEEDEFYLTLRFPKENKLPTTIIYATPPQGHFTVNLEDELRKLGQLPESNPSSEEANLAREAGYHTHC